MVAKMVVYWAGGEWACVCVGGWGVVVVGACGRGDAIRAVAIDPDTPTPRWLDSRGGAP